MENRLILKLRFLLFFLYGGFACLSPYLQVYFKSKNLTYTQMGIAFAGSSIIGVLVQPVWGYISDKYLNKRKTMIINTASSLVVVFLIFTNSFGAILFVLFTYNILACSLGSVSDAYIYDVVEDMENMNYSNFRYLASAAYALVNLLIGFAIKYYGFNFSLIVFNILTFICLVLLLNMKFEGRRNLQVIKIDDIKQILKNKQLIIFFMSIFFINSTLISSLNYLNELVAYTKGDVSKLGVAWFVTCLFEVFTFFAAARIIKKIGTLNVYMISVLIYVLKFLLDFIVKDANYIIAIQMLEGAAFTLYITSSLEYLMSSTDPRLRATTMSINATIAGLGGFILNLISGMLLNIINPSQLFGVYALVCFICFLCIVFLKVSINDIQQIEF